MTFIDVILVIPRFLFKSLYYISLLYYIENNLMGGILICLLRFSFEPKKTTKSGGRRKNRPCQCVISGTYVVCAGAYECLHNYFVYFSSFSIAM